MEITAEALGMARIGLGMERDELADRLGVSVRTIANWERNGVPQHRVVLVMSKFGQHIRAAQSAIEAANWHNSPEGMAQSEAAHAAYEAERIESGRPDGVYKSGFAISANDADAVEEFLALRELLAPYSTAGILREVMRRVGEAGIDSILSDANNSEPDYSHMSEADAKDYGLAASRGEDNIGHDELPHEP